FFGGVLFPIVVFGFLYLWPSIDRRVSGDRAEHHLLDRPRDAPWRTAVGSAFFPCVGTVFAFGAADRVFVELQIPYEGQLWVFRVLFFLATVVAWWVTLRVCR